MYDKVKPERVLFLKGDIKDSDGLLLDSVSLELKNLTTNEVTKISVNGGKYVNFLTLEESDDVIITLIKMDTRSILTIFLLLMRNFEVLQKWI